MGRILAIDYGKKRTGIAITDPFQIIATGLDTVPTHNLYNFLQEYFKVEIVDCIVFGMPKKMDNTDSEPVPAIRGAIKKCQKLFPNVKIETMDERFTSKLAFQAMIDGGVKKEKRKNKAMVDKVSATIILQSYLDFKSH